MQNQANLQELISDKTTLLLKFNYVSIFLSTVLGFFCLYFMKVYQVIPYVFFGYALINIINVIAFKKHGNLLTMAIVTSLLSLFATLIISLNNGGINSPFMFILAIIVLAGYITTRFFGQIYLYGVLAIITIVFLVGYFDTGLVSNEVPKESQGLFSFITMIFSVYLLGGIFGRNLLKTHHKLYKTKKDVESRIIEKENLLKEVHHRVKNNLQTVSSLLSLQSRNIEDDEVKSLFRNSQNRVISMAMVHEMLYMREDITKIEYKTYVQDLTEYLVRSIKGTSTNITLHINIQDIKLNIDTAIPLGLLINEVVTNALKYGIKDDDKGEIAISMYEKGEGYELTISDSGDGFASDITYKNTKSLGLKLIHNLARQLLGSVKRNTSEKGTHYTVTFKEIMEQIPSVA
ncbi:sensor histidine kinase [Aggregatimonas sangjinii]|uniref:histidine kinase n=1 Tax=Aggregatimonas sangjinii TaxID=2583587 RepID=A0A5B7SQA4_9FLAO|nr:sensor histidine kinase [Aggregatimonas sangjinii]QCX00727.1 sensor histidine kinase [Aggregatimonas sangjinii]